LTNRNSVIILHIDAAEQYSNQALLSYKPSEINTICNWPHKTRRKVHTGRVLPSLSLSFLS